MSLCLSPYLHMTLTILKDVERETGLEPATLSLEG